MSTLLKSCALVLSIATLFALPSGEATAESPRWCLQQYRDCLAYGGDPIACEHEYWACRGLQIPARVTDTHGAGNRND